MAQVIQTLQETNFLSAMVRLLLAAVLGGLDRHRTP